MSEMKVLTLHQPWASLVALGVKTIETRSWSTKYRGPLAIHAGLSKAGATQCSECWDAIYAENSREVELPLGALVATCTLVDVAPIGGPFSFRTGIWDGDEGDFPGQPVVVRSPAHLNMGKECLGLDHDGRVTDISDQLPYGDFTPGRYAWLLADVVPVDPPVSFRGGQGLTKTWKP